MASTASPSFQTSAGALATMRRAGLLICVLALGISLSAREKTAKIARADLPTRQEQAALLQRQQEFRKNHEAATIAVYPVQIGNAADSESADRIARLLDRLSIAGTAHVEPTTILPQIAVEQGADGSVWDLARAVRERLRQHPAAADYALFVSYTFEPEAKTWTVLRYVLCKANGDLVNVEHQDLRWPKYQVISSTTKSDCDEWIVFWLQQSSSARVGGALATNP